MESSSRGLVDSLDPPVTTTQDADVSGYPREAFFRDDLEVEDPSS
jgi:hypothetical protein